MRRVAEPDPAAFQQSTSRAWIRPRKRRVVQGISGQTRAGRWLFSNRVTWLCSFRTVEFDAFINTSNEKSRNRQKFRKLLFQAVRAVKPLLGGLNPRQPGRGVVSRCRREDVTSI